MSTFKFPTQICDKANSVIKRLWCSNKTTFSHYCNPISWDSTCRLKTKGCLGSRKIEDFNKGMLSKATWDLISQAQKLWSKS